MAWLVIIFAALFRAIHEHGKWRNSEEWSVLHNTWWLEHTHPYLLDGYHFTGGLMVVGLFAAGMLWNYQWHWLPVAWLVFWQVFNFFYHWVLTPKQNRDWRWLNI